ncbi:HD domain-containing protein [Umezakia ovalisporum]|jgi:(p)ppGpp synthase/HD superfamily hydrolase|uniref:HD domain-containing protein n=1 Tax=Umezakia ovalisporum TaxID=75695 RepID=UPI0006F10C65|nr:HD domain-containing protein [Umezakia ovalisporum]MDH6083370.1 HD domain-containing protein [Umezakia ovalisporum TAC611]MDH6088466.1 HD domain-containing protein [Umezakia ovalisporum Ak1311]CEJ48081.1 Metal dependent phosphohydrolase [Umezakia ovalisporum]
MKSTKLTAKFESALVYATRLHANQTRKTGGVPYIAHLLSVTALVLEAGGTEEEAIASLLHDSIEDQGGKVIRKEINDLFGETVAEIIDGCTEWDTPPKPPWKQRKQRYLQNLHHASPSVRLVSLADKLHNARSLLADWQQYGNSIWGQFKAGKEGTLWFYQELLKVYTATGSDFMTDEFSRVINNLRQQS